jgi:hypothetical protein
MNNEPVAWMSQGGDVSRSADYFVEMGFTDLIPLYTHPVKELKCIVKDCENHKHEGSFNGDVCSPCYQFIAHGKGVYSQAYRNAKPAELTDEEILQQALFSFGNESENFDDSYWIGFARAILRKAQEK